MMMLSAMMSMLIVSGISLVTSFVSMQKSLATNSLQVKTPVLPIQISLTAPSCSTDSIFLTKLLEFFIFITDAANDRVTQSGSPSGTATTMSVIDMMIKLIISFKVSIYNNLPSGLTETAITRLTVIAIKVAIEV